MWQQCVLLLEVKTETTNKKKGYISYDAVNIITCPKGCLNIVSFWMLHFGSLI